MAKMTNLVSISRNDTYSDEETEIQKIMSTNATYRSILDNSVPFLFLIFVGPLSDTFGRKIPLLISTLGTMMYSLLMLFLSYKRDSLDPLVVNLVGGFPQYVSGVR